MNDIEAAFERSKTASEFLDARRGYPAAIARMAREIERLRYALGYRTDKPEGEE